jgi:hypothetical protein
MNRRNLKPLPRSDAQLDAISTVTPQDVEQAGVDWKRWAKPAYKNLLEATEESESENERTIQ